MNDRWKAIARVTVPIVLVLLLSLVLVAFLAGGVEAIGATLATILILAIPFALLVGLVLFVLKRL